MPYIGRGISQLQTIDKLDAITPSTSTGAGPYNLTQSSSAFTPISANNLLISINGVVQYGNFTVSGSTVTFTGALSDSDTCNFILHVGEGIANTPAAGTVSTSTIAADAVTGAKIADDAIDSEHYTDGSIDTAHIADSQVTTAKIAADAVTGAKIADDAIDSEHYTDGSIDTAHIADDQITAAKINNDIISGLTELTSEPADTDEFLISDAGTLKRIDASLVGGGSVVKLASGSFSNNSLSFDGYFSADYSHYKVILTDIVPAGNNYDISIRYRQGNSDVTNSNYTTVGQYGAYNISGNATSNGSSHSRNGSSMNLHQGYAVSNAGGACMNGELTFFNPLSTSLYKHFLYKTSCFYSSVASGYWVTTVGGGYFDADQAALSGFTIFSTQGNITSGNVYLYGVKV